MRLVKWYGDWVDGAGAHVRYKAALAIGPLRISFEAALDLDHPPRPSFGSGRSALPKLHDGVLTWPAAGGGLAWAGAAPRAFDLAADRPGAVTWEPVVLAGAVTGPGVGPGRRGYAERLTLSAVPWSLGLAVLRWGRFCGPSSSLAWIEWEGRAPLRLALLDGREVPLDALDAREVIAGGARLAIGDARAFVDATIGAGLFGSPALWDLPLARRVPALAFLRGVERKFVAAGVLARPGAAPESGDVIFEEVAWS